MSGVQIDEAGITMLRIPPKSLSFHVSW